MNQPRDTAALYALTPEQVAFLRQVLEVVPFQGNRKQLMMTLAMITEVEAALLKPVEENNVARPTAGQ